MMTIKDDGMTTVDVVDGFTQMKPGYQIQLDELRNKVDELESELDAIETQNETLKEIIKTLAELL
jgi:DNA mismatch repair ATPase MutS